MSNYTAVTQALESGADPSMLCRTCPWTRQCITPPEMTAADVRAKIDEASKDPTLASGGDKKDNAIGQIMATMFTSALFAGADTKAHVCPVFAMRLREESGRHVADSIRRSMQEWADAPAS